MTVQIDEELAEPFALLLTDVVMPAMNGRVLAERLQRRWPNLRVLYMSGHTDDTLIRYGVEQGSLRLLQKPFTPRTLLQYVRAELDRPMSNA